MSQLSEQIKILCVDDERSVLRAIQRIFLDENYEIVLADSAAEGLKVMEEAGPFQVVISDYRMPVMSGVDFFRVVYERWPETVRIVLSGYADAGSIVAAINDGHIYKFIPKPWNDDELRITIQNCIERYYLLKSNRELLVKLAAANQALEEKVRRRTEQLELRNRALEFSQNLLGNLPVGVMGIDINGMIAYCNDIAVEMLKNACCRDIFGADVNSCCDQSINRLIELVRTEKKCLTEITLDGKPCRVVGRTMSFCDSETIVLVFMGVGP